jgi:Ca2+-binding RTX toxin-like protein
MSRRVGFLGVLAILVVALFAVPGAAMASTVSVSGNTLTYTDPAGGDEENNDLVITPGVGSFQIDDAAGVTITPTLPCTGGTLPGAPATCPSTDITNFVISLNEGDDSSDTSATPISIKDLYSGGTGTDTAAYEAATVPVRLDPDDNSDDGRDAAGDGDAEEQDQIGSDVENLIGGSGNDVLRGSNTVANQLQGNGGNDTLNGLTGNDNLIGNAGDDTFDGDAGTDTAIFQTGPVNADIDAGTADEGGADSLVELENTLSGDENVNVIAGGGGNDTLNGRDGDDNLNGDGDGDTVNGDAGADDVFGGAGNDTAVNGGAGADDVDGDAGNDAVNGGADNDTLLGDDNNDILDGGSGTDSLDGGNGTDTASYASAPAGVTANLASGASNDGNGATDTYVAGTVENLTGSPSADNLTGDTAANTISGGDSGDTLNGDDGADTVNGGNGDDGISGGAGNDGNAASGGVGLYGDAGDDTINGNAGDDDIDGGAHSTAGDTVSFLGAPAGANATLGAPGSATGDGTDRIENAENLSGSAANDSLSGDGNDNRLSGLGGEDNLVGGAGSDVFDGGDGVADVVSFAASASGVTANLTTNTANEGGSDTFVNLTVENLVGSPQADDFTGSSAANSFQGANGNDTMNGAAGADTLQGDGNNDTLSGGADNDSLFGHGNDDTLEGNQGVDALDGGANTDTATYANAPQGVIASLAADAASNDGNSANDTYAADTIENLTGSAQGDTLTGDDNANVLTGGGGVDLVGGGDGADTITGDAGNDQLSGGAGNDSGGGAGVFGGDGDDTVNGNAGNDNLNGGSHDAAGDTVSFAGAPGGVTASLAAGTASGDGSDTLATLENISGSPGADSLTGDGGANSIDGLAGNDGLFGGAGSDDLDGGTEDDNVRGQADADVLAGGDGNESGPGNAVNGGGGNDQASGGPGNDLVEGDDGDDELQGNAGTDEIDGGPGTDEASYENAAGAVTASLETDNATNDGDGGADTFISDETENLTGSAFGDSLTGRTGQANVVSALGGNDSVNVRDGGVDTANCGDGTDVATVDASPADNTSGCENVDSTGNPETTIDSEPPNPTNDNTPTHTFSSNEPGATFECRYDSDPFAPCSGNGTHTPSTPLTDGPHTFEVRAIDAGNNIDSSPASDTFTVDTGLPAAPTGLTTDPASPANDTTPNVKGSAPSDAVNVRVYTTSNCTGGATTGTKAQFEGAGITVTVPANQTTPLSAKSVDAANNESACSTSIAYVEDSAGPATPTISDSDPNSPANDNSPEIKGTVAGSEGTTVRLFTSSDCSGSPVASGTEAAFEGAGITVAVADNSTTQLRAIANDGPGNNSACSSAFSYVEDSSAPETTISSGPSNAATNDATPTFEFASSESGSSFECRVDEGAFGPCSGPGASHTTDQLADGLHTFEVRAIDGAGNADGSPASAAFFVQTAPPADTTPPETSIGRDLKKTTDRTPTFQFTSSEAGGGFVCEIDGGGFELCSSPYTTEKLSKGKHTLSVSAFDAAGNFDASPAVDRFKVKKKKKRR